MIYTLNCWKSLTFLLIVADLVISILLLFITYWILKSTPMLESYDRFIHVIVNSSFPHCLSHLIFFSFFYSFMRLHITRNKIVEKIFIKKAVIAFFLKCMLSVFSHFALEIGGTLLF